MNQKIIKPMTKFDVQTIEFEFINSTAIFYGYDN